jgi:hypothetical protein
LNFYFKKKLEELNNVLAGSDDSDQLSNHDLVQTSDTSAWNSVMDINDQETVISESSCLVKNIGKVVRGLRCLGFTSMAEDAYSSAIIWLLKVRILSYPLHLLFHSLCYRYSRILALTLCSLLFPTGSLKFMGLLAMIIEFLFLRV